MKRFLKRTATTKSGEKAIVEYILDEDKIREEEKYVATMLSPQILQIL